MLDGTTGTVPLTLVAVGEDGGRLHLRVGAADLAGQQVAGPGFDTLGVGSGGLAPQPVRRAGPDAGAVAAGLDVGDRDAGAPQLDTKGVVELAQRRLARRAPPVSGVDVWTAAVVTLTIRPVPLACIPGEEARLRSSGAASGRTSPTASKPSSARRSTVSRPKPESAPVTSTGRDQPAADIARRVPGAAAADLPGYLPCVPADFRGRVLAALASVRPGEVVSYGDLAAQAGYPGAARGVGAVLAGSTPDQRLAWWRVVYADGRLAPGHEPEQARLLASEGVVVRDGRVVPAGGEPAGSSGRPAPLRRTAAGRSR